MANDLSALEAGPSAVGWLGVGALVIGAGGKAGGAGGEAVGDGAWAGAGARVGGDVLGLTARTTITSFWPFLQ